MISLKNDWIRLELDENANLTWLEDLKSGNGNIITQPKPVFRAAILRTADAVNIGENKEDMAFAKEQDITVSQEGTHAVITVHNLKTRMGEKDAEIRLTLDLDNQEVVFGGQIKNNSDSCIDELIYPCIGSIDSLGNGAPDLLWPLQSGERIHDICSVLKNKTSREELHEFSEVYPGYLSMSWTALTDDRNCLYMACYDNLFHVMTMRAKGSNQGGVTLEIDKMCFVKKGETWDIPNMVIRLYKGSWRRGADEYAAWASTWRKPIEQQAWVKKLNGYFLVINKQQFGYESWPYETLPELYEYAQAHGYDCIGLFGWYHSGHDNNYPDLDVSPTMGGAEGLKAGIKAIQEKGGHVTLYYQGHLMDTESPFYKREGQQWEGRNIWGNPYYEFYPKFCYSDKLRFFSRKAFSTICPSVTLWHDMMAKRIEWIADFGADGALYDQIGGMPPYPCFNEKHNHVNNKPSLSHTQGRLQLHRAIRKSVEKHQNFAFMSEHITDIYSQFLDCVHGIASAPSARGGGMQTGSGVNDVIPGSSMMPQLFRYCFPETMITVRNSHPYMEERMTNYAFEFGFKFEMELRYDTDLIFIREDSAPEKRIYAKQVADLRRRYEAYLLTGTFRADEGIIAANMYANVFRAADGTRVAALWNDSDEALVPRIELEQGNIVGWSTVNGDGEGVIGKLPSNGIAVLRIQD